MVDMASLMPADPVKELLYAAVLGVYVLGVIYATKFIYEKMRARGVPHNVAIYYNRKIIHMAAGGVVALLVPFLFSSPLIPLLMALALTIFVLIPRKKGKLMYWFQTEENAFEANFTIAWGLSIFILWILLGDPKLAVVPALFIAFGDAVTGIIRNYLFRKRTKHWAGNLGMLLVTLPIGFYYAGIPGAIAAVAASILERFEFPPIDDNVIIVVVSSVILALAA